MGKQGRSLVRIWTVAGVLVLGIAAAAYLVLAPYIIARYYNERIGDSVQALREAYAELEGTLDMDVFILPGSKPEQNIVDLDVVEGNIATANQRLDDFEQQTASYSQMRYSALPFVYESADATAENVGFMIAQSEQVLGAYAELIAFLKVFSRTQAAVEKQLDDINAVMDFNPLIGTHDDVYERARNVADACGALGEEQAPTEYEAARNAILALCQELSEQLDRLADGLSVAVDERIYGAVSEIERITRQYESSDRYLVFTASQESPTLGHVRELSEKLTILEATSVR
jgi:hypothetical protein